MLISYLDFFLSYTITLLALLSFWKQGLKYVLHCTGRGRRDGEGRKYIHTYIQTHTHIHIHTHTHTHTNSKFSLPIEL